jgi:hypothetical protein
MTAILIDGLIIAVSLAITLWMAGALHYDVGRAGRNGLLLSLSWLAAVVAGFLVWHPLWKPFLLLVGVAALFLLWWFSQRPTHNRPWDQDFVRLPRIALEGDLVTIQNVRNTQYHGIGERTTHLETRSYHLAHLQGLDALILTWDSPWMCHPMFVFDFGADGRVCFSIEVRYRQGQTYSLLRSLYRQQELMVVVSDDRDAILRRTLFLEGHDLFLYRLNVGPLALREFFFEYANTINTLVDRPQWYHGLTANCTTSIYSQGRARLPWHWRLLLNGAFDRLLYEHGFLDQSLPFETLKQQSRLNEIANRAPAEDFGDHIRRELPGYRMG